MWIFSFWVFPVISACMWLATLITLIVTWSLDGYPTYPDYPSMDPGQNIAYISDVGAYGLKPFFITGCAVTMVFLVLAFMSERWLRHTGRLAPNTSLAQKILSGFSIIFAIAGSAGLILLSIFDTHSHNTLHNVFLVVFIGGYVISAIFICAEYQRLGIHYRNHRILAISFWVKLTFILVEIVFCVCFVATSRTDHRDVAAVFEWIIAFVFTFYVMSFVIDLLPSVRTKKHVPQGLKDTEMANQHRYSGSTQNVGYEYQQPVTTDSVGPNNGAWSGVQTDGQYRGVGPTQARY